MEIHPAEGVAGLPPGVGAYPGGCLLRLEPDGKTLTKLCRLPEGQGIITFTADFARERLYCLAWPNGKLCVARPSDDSNSDEGGKDDGSWLLDVYDYPGRGGGEGVHVWLPVVCKQWRHGRRWTWWSALLGNFSGRWCPRLLVAACWQMQVHFAVSAVYNGARYVWRVANWCALCLILDNRLIFRS